MVGGGPVEYSCEATGSPAPTIIWYYNGAVVQSGSGGVVVGGDGTLTIPVPQVSHSGIYQCFARNQFGDDSQAWTLEVKYPGTRVYSALKSGFSINSYKVVMEFPIFIIFTCIFPILLKSQSPLIGSLLL